MTSGDEYRSKLLAEAEILQLMPQKELWLWTDQEIRAVLTRMWIAELELPLNTVFSDEQFWKIAEHRFPDKHPNIERRLRAAGGELPGTGASE
jgi:hypothetical protein